MDLQKEKIAHEKHLLSQGVDFKYLPNIQYNELENVYELIEWCEEYSEALNEINSSWCTWQAAKAQAVQEWISVDDEPPTPNKTFSDAVIAWDGVCVRRIPLCLFNSASEVTHWMPIPQPPKAQEPANE